MDKHIRFRLRMCIWKHWKNPQNRAKNLIKLGISKKYAWSTAYTGAKNSHLVWVRGISQPEYHGGLAVANVLASVFAVGIFYVVLAVYAVINGHAGYLPKLIPAYMMVAVSVSIVSLFVSVLSIKLPGMLVGGLGALFAGIGVFHGMFDLLKSVIGGPGGKCISVFLWLIPDLNEIQKQAYNLVIGKNVEWHLIWTGLFVLWVISLGLFVIKRKEA